MNDCSNISAVNCHLTLSSCNFSIIQLVFECWLTFHAKVFCFSSNEIVSELTVKCMCLQPTVSVCAQSDTVLTE